jgi:hypothetical protein
VRETRSRHNVGAASETAMAEAEAVAVRVAVETAIKAAA